LNYYLDVHNILNVTLKEMKNAIYEIFNKLWSHKDYEI
jgi:hypothetical protein